MTKQINFEYNPCGRKAIIDGIDMRGDKFHEEYSFSDPLRAADLETKMRQNPSMEQVYIAMAVLWDRGPEIKDTLYQLCLEQISM